MNKNIKIFLGFLAGSMLLSFQNCAESIDYTAFNNSGDGSSVSDVAPKITALPNSFTRTVGSSLIIEAQIEGSNTTVEWYKNSVKLPLMTSRILTMNNLQASDAGTYRIVVSNSLGQVSAETQLNVAAAITPTPIPTPMPPAVSPPIVTTAPVNVTASYINSMSFFTSTGVSPNFASVRYNVVATGQSLTYQWYFLPNNSNTATVISGATNSTYSFNMTSTAQAGTYRVVIRNPGGSTARDATLTYEVIDINVNF